MAHVRQAKFFLPVARCLFFVFSSFAPPTDWPIISYELNNFERDIKLKKKKSIKKNQKTFLQLSGQSQFFSG